MSSNGAPCILGGTAPRLLSAMGAISSAEAAKGRAHKKATGSAIRKVMSKPQRKSHSENGTTEDPFPLTLRRDAANAPARQSPGKPRSQFLHTAWIILSSRCGTGTQHSGFYDIQRGSAHQKGDNDPGNDL